MAAPTLDSCYRFQEGFRLRRPLVFVGSPEETNVPEPYITLLQHFCKNQRATVKTDVRSRQFNIERGVKQGDPLSSYLFNALLEHIFRNIKPTWTRKGFGIQFRNAQKTRLTNLRLANDVLLLAPKLRLPKYILRNLKHEAAKCGLALNEHPHKC